jgi:hypothetical protein
MMVRGRAIASAGTPRMSRKAAASIWLIYEDYQKAPNEKFFVAHRSGCAMVQEHGAGDATRWAWGSGAGVWSALVSLN